VLAFSAAGSAHRLNRRFSIQCVGLTGELYRVLILALLFRVCFRVGFRVFLGLSCVGLASP